MTKTKLTLTNVFSSDGDIDLEMMDDGISTHSLGSNNEEGHEDTISEYEDRSFR